MSSIAAKVYDGAFPVAQSDATNDANGPFAALWIGVGGTLKFTDATGNTSATTVGVGEFPVRIVRVWSTGTAATGILGLKAVP